MYYPSSLRKSISIAKKDLLIYYGKGPVVIFGILLPFFFFFSFLIGREMPPLSLISGLGGMAIWFTATSISPVIAPMETRTRTLERLVSMPISVTEMLMGDILASMTMGGPFGGPDLHNRDNSGSQSGAVSPAFPGYCFGEFLLFRNRSLNVRFAH